ncbi:unnamed protein product [Brassica rapa subsp. trilocularis]
MTHLKSLRRSLLLELQLFRFVEDTTAWLARLVISNNLFVRQRPSPRTSQNKMVGILEYCMAC